MTGPYDGIFGMEGGAVIHRFLTSCLFDSKCQMKEERYLSAKLIDIDQKTGKAKKIERILINEDHPFMH